ncbi:MAG TPA: hypothetical protein VMN36_03895 [Verrucomicrobiales bacterium]|nr:hypothetical protein [Verrucomicrobiales bacterium]
MHRDRFDVSEQIALPIPYFNRSQSGGHHLTVDTLNDRVFVGSNEGKLYAFRLSDLHFLSVLDGGSGCGHVTLCPEVGLAVTTNHASPEMTLFDIRTLKATGNVSISSPAVDNNKTQGHTSKWFSSAKRLITTAAQDGRIVEIDPAAQKITREIHVSGGYLIQGCFAST